MDFDAWTTSQSDRQRTKRLTLSYAAGLIVVGIGMGFVAYAASGSAQAAEDDTIEVELAKKIEVQEEPEPEPEPEPEIEPEPEPEAPKNAPPPNAGPKLQALQTPDEIPDDVPDEKEPTKELFGDDPYAQYGAAGNPYGGGGSGTGYGKGPAKKTDDEPKPKPKPKPRPKRTGPVQLPENATPPKALSQPQPPAPKNFEGIIIVSYVVGVDGSVTSARVVRGDPSVGAQCVAAVKAWRFSPAMHQGQPIAVYRVHRFRFKVQ